MSYAVAANALILLHGAFILFAIFGGLLAARRRAWAALHLPAFAWAAWIGFSGSICPLTPLENHYRALAGGTPYGGGFIQHYVLSWIYPAGLTHATQIGLASLLLLVNLATYAWALRRTRR